MEISVYEFLSHTGKMLLSENMLIVAVILWSVRGHFKKLEKGLGTVAVQIKELANALIGLEGRHSGRLEAIEKRVGRLENEFDGPSPIVNDDIATAVKE